MQMSIARQRGGHLSDDMIALASDGAQANHEANIAWERAIRQTNDQALYYLNAAGNDPAETTEAIRNIMRRVRIRYGDEAYTGEAIVDGTLGIEAKRAVMRFTNETWANNKSIDLAATRDELAEIWVRAGLGDEAPSVINKKEMKDALWHNYWTKQKEFWQNYRDLYAQHANRIIEDMAGFAGIEPDTRMAQHLLDRARRYDSFLLDSEIWYDLQRAIKKTDWAAAARIYAHQFGIPSIMADEARRVPGAYLDENLLLNIVNSRSGGRYTELADVPPHVSRQAMLEHAIGEATRDVLDTVTDDRLATAVSEFVDRVREGGLGAMDARDRNVLQFMLGAANEEEANEIRRIFAELDDIEETLLRTATEEDIMQARMADTLRDEKIDEFGRALERIGRRIDAESVPLRMRLGITNVEGLTQPIDELVAKARELEQAGDIAGAQESYKTAVQYGIEYMQDVFGDYIDNIEYSIGRFWGDVEPTIYITTTEISNAELPDFIYTLQRLARTKFKQQAVISYGPPLPKHTTFGNVIRENGMLSRVEPALEVDFTRALSEDDMRMLDELMSEFGIGGGTMKPGNTGIEIVHNSWYNVIYGEQIGDSQAWKAASSGFVGELERRGLVQGFNLGPREVWSIGAGQEGDSVRAIARGLGFTGDDWQERLAEYFGSRLYRSYDDYYDSLRGGEAALQAQQRLDEAVYRPAGWSRELARDIAARLPTEKPKLTPDMKPWAGGIPSEARVMYEQRDGLRIFRDRITAGIRQNWGDVVEVKPKRSVINAIKDWAKEAEPRVAISRLVSGEVARAARDFILHAYPKRRNFDLLLSYIYPFHFWYNRTYFNWAKRIVLEPEVLTAYAIYKNTLSKIHADMPEWWRYNVNTNDLFGINAKNPLFFNLEATLVPFYGLTGVDFNDPRKRVNWWTSVLDDLGKHGPSVWTPFQVATALALYQQGEKEAAARWGTRLIPQTGVLKSISALLGVPGGWEIDPNILLFHNGLDIFERRRIGRSAGQMIEEGLASQSEAEDAMFNMEGDVWDESRTRAALGRAPGSLTSFFFGAGFRIRPVTDQQIDVMDDYLHRFYSMEENLSPDEVADTFAWFRQEFPFFDTVILSRKREEERDRVYAYSVLGRVPPGQKNDMFDALSVDPKLVDKFYEEKGRIWEWPQGDQEKFMAAIVELGALLEMPDTATQVEWRDASRARGDLEDEIIELFGEDIDEKMDVYFNKRRTSTDLANDYLDANPDLADAMDFRTNNIQENWLLNKYYGSIENTRSYMRGKMFDNIEYQLGEDIWDKWDAYFDAKLLGDDVARDFWKENPELEEYIRLRDEWEGIIAEQLADIEVWLPEKPYPVMRHGIPEELSVGQERVMEQLEDAGMPEAYGFSWADWQEFMSPELSNLIVDSAVGGEALSENAVESIERLAGNLGIDTELMVELLEESALQQYEPVRLSIKEAQLEQMEEVTYLLGEDEALTDEAKEIIKRHAMEIPPMSTKFGRDALHVQGYAMSLPESIARREETGFRRFAYAHGGQYDKSAQIHRHEFGHIIDFTEEISRQPEFQKAVWNWYNRSVEAYEKTGDPEQSDNRPIEAVDYARGVGKNVHLFWMEVYAHLFHKLAWAHSNVPEDVKQYYDPYLTMKVEEGS
jgi:hypothetical protein